MPPRRGSRTTPGEPRRGGIAVSRAPASSPHYLDVIYHGDVLAAAFGVPDGTEALGALAVVSDTADLKIFSRTFNTTQDGTYGQGFAGVPAADLIPADVRKRILFFTENDAYRSNIGLLNGTGSPITIMWERFAADGGSIDTGSADLPAWGNVQLNRVFQDEAPIAAASIEVWTTTEDRSCTPRRTSSSPCARQPTSVSGSVGSGPEPHARNGVLIAMMAGRSRPQSLR